MLTASLAIAINLLFWLDTPPLPFADDGACPFECCHYGTWTAQQSASARKDRNKQSPVEFRIASGEKVTAVTGVVVTHRPGVVRMLKTTKFEDVEVPAGALLYVLHYGGEGSDLFWYQGKAYWGELYAETVHKASADLPWDVESVPTTEWWVKVQNSRGAIGWVLMPVRFDGMDACG